MAASNSKADTQFWHQGLTWQLVETSVLPMALVALGEHSFVHCPACGAAISFLQGQEHPPETNVIEVAAETMISLVCPKDGKFEVPAGVFRNNSPECPQL
jgi:hypothetical protein